MAKTKKPKTKKTILPTDLDREYTATTIGILSTFDGASVKNITPRRMASLLKMGEINIVPELLSIAELMEERDPHYASVLGVRKRGVLNLKYIISATSDNEIDVQIADEVNVMITNIDLYALMEQMLDAIGKGFSVVEMFWDYTTTAPVRFEYCDPKLFTYDQLTGREIRLISDKDINGEVLPEHKFIYHRPFLKSGRACRDGIARSAIWSWMLKNYTLADWANFCEQFGIPTRIGKFNSSSSAEDKETLQRALRGLGNDAAAMIPETMNIEFNSAGDIRGNATVFKDMAEYIDKQLSKLILGQTMTSDNGSSQAQATVHNDVRHDIIVSDAVKLAKTLTRDLITPFVQFNFGTDKAIPQFIFITEDAEDLTSLSNNISKLVPLGLEISKKDIAERFGLKSAEDVNDILKPNLATLNTQDNKQEGTGAEQGVNKSLNKVSDQQQKHNDYILDADTAIDNLTDEIAIRDAYSAPIKQALNECLTIAEFESKLLDILSQIMDNSANNHNIDALGRANNTAFLNGELSVDINDNGEKKQVMNND